MQKPDDGHLFIKLNHNFQPPGITIDHKPFDGATEFITLADHQRLVKEAVEACAEILDAKAADHDADAARFRGGSEPHYSRSFLAKTAREHAAAIRARASTPTEEAQ